MADLERALRDVGADWPPTPDLAGAVLARIAADDRPRTVPSRRPRLRAALAAVLVALGGAFAIEPSRAAILDFFGFGGVRVERRAPTATPSPPPPGAALGRGLGLGTPVTARQAARRARGFVPAPPTALGAADAVFFAARPPEGGRVSYVYRARRGLPRSAETGAGLLVTEMRARVGPFAQKAAGPGTTITRLRVGGDPALYLAGRPHGFAYADPGGGVAFEDQRLAAPTLLVERGDGVLIRVEGRVSRARAARIARSVPR